MTMKRITLFVLLAVLAVFTVACGGNENGNSNAGDTADDTITITHELGETPVKKNPENVVVFDFGILDSLHELGVEIAGLPKMAIPSYLAEYESETYENLGSLKEPDFEKIAEIQPELIIISTRQADIYEQFAEIAPTVYLEIDTADYIESFKSNMRTLGEIFAKETEVDAQLAEIDESIRALNEKVSPTEKKALIVLANEGKVSAYGPNSRFGLIHDAFGIEPADESIQVSTHGQSISFEYIVEKDPDYLYVIDRGAAIGEESSAKQVVENQLVKKTKAYQEGNVIYLDPDYWYLSSGGLVAMKEMVKEIDESYNE